MTDINIIVGVQSGDALRQLSSVQKGVDQVGAATKRTSQQLKQHATEYNKTAVAANKFGKGLAQQAGYQVADFAVQLQNGTSFLQAFGQQGSQMLAVFGPLGSVLGAVVAVGAALGTVFVKSTGATKDFKDGIEELKEETEKLNKEFEILSAGVTTYGQLAALQKIAHLNTQILELTKEEQDILDKRNSGFRRDLKNIGDQIDKLEIQRNETQAVLDNFNKIRKQIAGLDKEGAFARVTRDILMFGDGLDTAVPPLSKLEISIRHISREIMMFGDGLDTLPRKLKDVSKEVSNVTKEIVMFGDGLDTLPDPFEKTRKSVAEVTKDIMMFGDGLEDAFVVPEDKSKRSIKKISTAIRDELSPEMQRIKDVSETIGSSFENALMSATRGTLSVRDAFRAMATDIIAELYRVFVVKQITGFVTQTVAGMFGSPLAPSQSLRPRARPMANGGPVSAGSPYMVGERGPELMIPNQSGSIIPNDKLGGGTVVVNQNINVTTGVQQTVRAEILGLMPQIQEASKAAVLDAKRRGGSFAGAF